MHGSGRQEGSGLVERSDTGSGDPLWSMRFRRHVFLCLDVGAPLYADLFGRIADDLAAGGPFLDLIAPCREEPEGMLLPLRLMAQVHYWVLRGELPELAACYPTAGGTLPGQEAWPVFQRACLERGEELQRLLGSSSQQANYVSRCAPLMGGFLQVARQTGLPLRLLEVGCSGGLLLRWDQYRDAPWLPSLFDVAPPLDGEVRVAERRGCDPDPIDPTTDEGALRLKSYVYADAVADFRALEEAIDVCRTVPAEIDRADGGDWLPEQLARRASGVATVVYHSLVAEYASEESLARMREAIERAAASASPEAPLAWLRFEAPAGAMHERGLPTFEARLAQWPGGDDRLVATAHLWGRRVRWHG